MKKRTPVDYTRAWCRLELMEDRWLPSVNLLSGFAGLDFATANQAPYPTSAPPDSIAAAGPGVGNQGYIVTAVNTDLAIYTKSGTLVSQKDFHEFFAPVNPGADVLSDPILAYDEQAQRFFVAILDLPDTLFFSDSYLLYAVSDSSDPTADTNGDGRAFSEMQRIRVHDDGTGSLFGAFSDYPRVGWNADAHVFTFNMFDGFLGTFQRVEVLEIDKSQALDRNPATFTSYKIFGSNVHFTMAPATMHNSQPGDPMWFVEEESSDNASGRNQVRLVKFDHALNTQSADVHQYLLNVDPYISTPSNTGTPPATQPGGGAIATNDCRFLNAEWRRFGDGSEHLVATHTVGLSTDAESHARWLEFRTDGASPTLLKKETLDPGPGIFTYFPSVSLRPDGGVGMTYMQSSGSEYMSMYVTGRTAAESQMEAPVVAKAGETTYTSTFGDNPYRAGDFSGNTVDPTDGTWWMVNEYAKTIPGASANWGTWLANVTLSLASVHDIAITSVNAPSPVTQGNSAPVSVAVANQGSFAETINVTLIADNATPGNPGDDITIATWRMPLAAGASTTLSTTWNTTGANTGTQVLTATADVVPGETDTADNTAAATVIVNPPVVGNPNDMYVWDIAFEQRVRGGNKVDERVSVTIRRDSNANGVADAADAVVAGATVTFTVTGRGTFTGTTDSTGVVRTGWLMSFANGTYVAEVTNLTKAGLTWNKNLDPVAANGDTDLYPTNNLPEQQIVISGARIRGRVLGAFLATASPGPSPSPPFVPNPGPGGSPNTFAKAPAPLLSGQLGMIVLEPQSAPPTTNSSSDMTGDVVAADWSDSLYEGSGPDDRLA